jgi:hypothetical protein
MNTSGWGTKTQADGTVKKYKVVLDLDVLTGGKADTEFQSMVKSLEIDLGPRLIAKLPMLTCASVITDHANTAHLGAEMWVKEKQDRWELVPAGEKAKTTPAATKLAEKCNIRKCGQHLINVLSSNYLGTKQKPRFKDGNPDEMAMTHGKREFTVLSRLCGVGVLGRHFEVAEGRAVAVALRGKPPLPPSLGKAENAPPLHYSKAEERVLCRWEFQWMSHHWHKCPRNKDPKPFGASTIPSISNGLYAGSKLLSNRGDHSFYHLNTCTVLEEWMRQNGHVLLAVFLAFKGSRFNWHLKACPAFLLNYEVLLTFMHTLLAAADDPNRLVVAVFDFLSNKYCMAGLAARCVVSVEVIDVMTFAFKALGTRWEQHTICQLVAQQLRKGLPRRGLVDALLELAPDHIPDWKTKLEKWADSQEEFWDRVYKGAESYSALVPVFVENGCQACYQI